MSTTRYECSVCGGWIRSEGGEGDSPCDRDNVDTSETCGGCSPVEDRSDWWSDMECSECGSVLLNGEAPAGLCMGCEDYAEERDPARADEREGSKRAASSESEDGDRVSALVALVESAHTHDERDEALRAVGVALLRDDIGDGRAQQLRALLGEMRLQDKDRRTVLGGGR